MSFKGKKCLLMLKNPHKFNYVDLTSTGKETHQAKMAAQNKVILKSTLEFKFARKLDLNPDVISWQYEGFRIQYYDSQMKKFRHYYPDFLVVKKDGVNEDGSPRYIKAICEIKPSHQSINTNRISDRNEEDVINNRDKWYACAKYCLENNMKFEVFTDKSIR